VSGTFVVADDGVVEIGDPEGAVGAELHLHGAERGVVAGEEVGISTGGEGRGAAPIEAVAVDAAGDGIAVEEYCLEIRAGKVRRNQWAMPAMAERAVVVGA